MKQVKVFCIFLLCLSFCLAAPVAQEGGFSFSAMEANQPPAPPQVDPFQNQMQIQANMGSDIDISDLAL
ncbi:unnamed protein product [Diamesa serratosioi]